MRPVRELSAAASQIRAVFCDIDDTLTVEGRLCESAFSALWELTRQGLPVVCVTGRPAGWCDAIVRQWPIAGIVGENGAFSLRLGARGVEVQRHPAVAERSTLESRFAAILSEVQREVPEARVAQDQDFRWYDLAIDFAEDEPRLGAEEAQAIATIFARHGATAKISSIHVNGWFGDYDKRGMCIRFATEALNISDADLPSCGLFVGDSPNDAPLFAYFEHSVGVNNVLEFGDLLATPPRYLCEGRGGEGFAECVEALLMGRGAV